MTYVSIMYLPLQTKQLLSKTFFLQLKIKNFLFLIVEIKLKWDILYKKRVCV